MYKKNILNVVRKILYLPISPMSIKAGVELLRYIGILKKNFHVEKNRAFRRILISHPYTSVGDVVLALPLVEQVHRLWPDALIDIAVGSNMAKLFVGHQGVNQVFRYKGSGFKQSLIRRYLLVFKIFALYRREIMQRSYDLVIVPRWDSDADALVAKYLAYLTNATYSCAYSAEVSGGDVTIDALFSHVAHGGDLEHEVLRYTRLLSRVGLTSRDPHDISLVREPIKRLIEVADENGAPELTRLAGKFAPQIFETYVVVSPGATNPRRIWSHKKLTQLMTMLHNQYGFSFLIAGTPSDASSCEQLAQSVSECAVSIAGKTNMLQLTAIIRHSVLFIGNDSGPGHIAGALGIPTVIASPFPLSCKIDHPNAPARFHPCGPRVKVVQPATPRSPCYPCCSLDVAHCIEQISADDMFLAAKSLLNHFADES
jgi:ADP-heptose:LPS heptosyltransferase